MRATSPWRRWGRWRWARFSASEGGQLLLLAGVILVLSFIVTALTLNQVANLEEKVSGDQNAPLQEEFRYLRTELNRTLDDTVTLTTTNATFLDTFDRLVASLEVTENSRGYDVVIALGDPDEPVPLDKREEDFTSGGNYDDWSFDGRRKFNGNPYDGVNDGVIVYKEAADASAHIKGAVIYIYLADQTGYAEETFLLALNV